MVQPRQLRNLDLKILLPVISLITLGFLAIYSTTRNDPAGPMSYVGRQFFSLIIGLAGFFLFLFWDWSSLKKISRPFYLIMMVILAGLIALGELTGGVKRWLAWGPFSLQPAELGKLAVIFLFAEYFSSRPRLDRFLDLLPSLGLTIVPFILIFLQPDLGTATTLWAIWLGCLIWAKVDLTFIFCLISPVLSIVAWRWPLVGLVYTALLLLFLANRRWKWLDIAVVVGLNLATGTGFKIFWNFLKAYQKRRILSFLNPGLDPLGSGYHSLQSKIAIGSGGFFGKGIFQGTQTTYQFIPEQHTDFIFTVIGEELGFIGIALVIGLLGLILYRGIRLAAEAEDGWSSFVAAGCVCLIAFQMLVNIGMTMGIMPVVGIPLPFLSFGGSALVVNLCAIGFLENIALRRRKILF